MPAQFDRLADVESHRRVGHTLGRVTRRGRWALVTAGAVTAVAVVALAAPSALAGGSGRGDAAGAITSASSGAQSSSQASDDAEKKAAEKKAAEKKAAEKKAAEKKAAAKKAAEKKAAEKKAAEKAAAEKAAAEKAAAEKKAANEPVPATESSYAKNIPDYPPDGGYGRRIVYSKALMHVWIVNSKDEVVRHYPVTGRWDRPVKGTYKIYSMSTDTMNEHSKVTFQWMVRFAWGFNDTGASIGFHSIPIYYEDVPEKGAKKGDRMSSQYELGLPVASGGCVRQADDDAEFLYRWAEVGDKVVVLPTAD